MTQLPHIAFYINNPGHRNWLMEELTGGTRFTHLLPAGNCKGEVFSGERLQYFLDEELRHDHMAIAVEHNNTLATSSSGEQRKALINYLVNLQPAYIIVDNVFDSLDSNNRLMVLERLQQLSNTTLFIQLLTRRAELLPFVTQVYVVNNQQEISLLTRDGFTLQLSALSTLPFETAIPPALSGYTAPAGALIKMTNVSVHFDGRPILKEVCWEIKQGEFWHLKGPNGAGKSTLLALITGNSPKGYGQDLELFGKRKGSGESVWEIKEKIGYFDPVMTLHFERGDTIEQMIVGGFFDSVGLYLRPSDQQLEIAQQWIKLLDLREEAHQPFRLAAPGYQRLVMIARAMVKHPLLLILDEPTAGLSDTMAALVIGLINKLASETTTAIIYVSHKEEPGLQVPSMLELVPTPIGSVARIYPQPSVL